MQSLTSSPAIQRMYRIFYVMNYDYDWNSLSAGKKVKRGEKIILVAL